ncbi:MAG: transglutaminase family protein [Candidatus Schekmanbacteria bacterium]|nr:transglutaminase family protein [Candidatus Schekmanbacteria bacterium]
MNAGNRFRSLVLGLVIGAIVLSINTASAIVSQDKSAASLLTQQLDELSRALKDGKTLEQHKISLNNIQKQFKLEFVQSEKWLREQYNSEELNILLSRQKEAEQIIDQHFAQLNQSLAALNVQDLQNRIQHLINIKHQSLDPKNLPVSVLNLTHPILNKSWPQLPIQPQAEDLAAAFEAPLNQSLKDLAGQLNNDPQQIFHWVYNNIQYRPGYGSWQGAQVTLDSKSGNAYDQSALLIALLRSAEIPARYVYGELELSDKQLTDWLGVTETKAACQLLDQAGMIKSGHLIAHVWIKAYNPQEKRWLDLDPSLKQYEQVSAPAREQDKTWIQGLLKFALPSASSPISVLPEQETVNKVRIIPLADKNFTYHYQGEARQLPSALIAKLELSLADADYSLPLQEAAGQSIAIAYLPAQNIDGNLIKKFEEKSENLPAYLIKLQPFLLLGNKYIQMGKPVTMGTPQTLSIKLTIGENINTARHLIFAGMSASWAGNWGQNLAYSKVIASGIEEKFNAYVTDSIRQKLYLNPLNDITLAYQQQNQRLGEILADYSSYYFAPGFSESLAATSADVDFAFTVPMSFSLKGVQLDVQKDQMLLSARFKDLASGKYFLTLKGSLASALEHVVLEVKGNPIKKQDMEAVSAIKVLTLALDRNIPLVTLDRTNFEQTAHDMDISPALYQDLQGLVLAGKTIVLPRQMLQLDDWRGIGYIVQDGDSGSSAFMLSSGIGGGASLGATAVSTFNVPFPQSSLGKIIMVAMILGTLIIIALSA